MRNCTDPMFIGTTLHATIDGEWKHLASMTYAKQRTDGTVDFTTKNETFLPSFTSDDAKEEFISQCIDQGKLIPC